MHLSYLVVMAVLFGLAGLAAGLGLGGLARRGWQENVGSWNWAAVGLAALLAIVAFARAADPVLFAALGGGGVIGLVLGFL